MPRHRYAGFAGESLGRHGQGRREADSVGRYRGGVRRLTLIPRSARFARVSKDAARYGASWFETALTRFLTMRVESSEDSALSPASRCRWRVPVPLRRP